MRMQDRGYQGVTAAVDLLARDGKHCRRGIFKAFLTEGALKEERAWQGWRGRSVQRAIERIPFLREEYEKPT